MTRIEKELILEVLQPYTISGKVSEKKLMEVLEELVDDEEQNIGQNN